MKSFSTLCFSSLCAFSLCHATAPTASDPCFSVCSAKKDPIVVTCGKSPQHMRASVRYTTPRGVGYAQGYTTLEGFFAPRNLLEGAFLPFVDLRGHVFDNGKLAANAGVGLRGLVGSRIWGINAYYDYRNTKHQHYNQVSAGLEALGRIWDFRINGYLPVGWKSSPLFFPRFGGFSGHNLLIRFSQQFAMKGANAEAGFHLDHFKQAPLYFAAGPYYLTGKGATTWGGSLRTGVDLCHRYLRIEGNTSYDHVFKWIGQAQVSINIPFGGRSKILKKEGHPCGQDMDLNARMAQRIDRNEIIPVDQRQLLSAAINPLTGLPWHIVFVKNTSASLGTYESPYPTLLAAQNASSPNDMIFVYTGDGTSRGMNAGITLKNGQMFLGSATAHAIPTTAGTIVVPPQTTGSPQITTASGDVITLNNNNTVSGFYILANNSSHSGMSGSGIFNLTADHNTIVTTTTDTNGIYLSNPTGNIFVTNSTFSGFSCNNGGTGYQGNGIYVEMSSGTLGTLGVSGCSFTNMSNPGESFGGNGILTHLTGGAVSALSIAGSSFTNITGASAGEIFTGGAGIYAYLEGGSLSNMTVIDNTFNNFTNSASGIQVSLRDASCSLNNLHMGDNSFHTMLSQSSGVLVDLDSGKMSTVAAWANSFENINAGSGINLEINNGHLDSIDFWGNSFSGISNTGSDDIIIAFSGGSLDLLNLSGNAFSNIGSSSGGIDLSLDGPQPVFSNISSNIFTSDSASTTGWGASITVDGSSTCLNFQNNMATPIANLPAAYQLQQTSGTFNLTPGSNGANNIGSFSNSGTIGSCFE